MKIRSHFMNSSCINSVHSKGFTCVLLPLYGLQWAYIFCCEISRPKNVLSRSKGSWPLLLYILDSMLLLPIHNIQIITKKWETNNFKQKAVSQEFLVFNSQLFEQISWRGGDTHSLANTTLLHLYSEKLDPNIEKLNLIVKLRSDIQFTKGIVAWILKWFKILN